MAKITEFPSKKPVDPGPPEPPASHQYPLLSEKRIDRITFRLSDTLKHRLERHAEDRDISLSELLNVISDWYLRFQEDLRRTLSDPRVLNLELATEKLRLALADDVLTLAEKADIQPHLSEVEHEIWRTAA